MPEHPRAHAIALCGCVIAANTAVAVLMLGLVLFPDNSIRRLADRTKHAEDVTPERVDRLKVVSGALALAHAIVALVIATVGRRSTLSVLDRLLDELSGVRPGAALHRLASDVIEPGWLHGFALVVVLGTAATIRLQYLGAPLDYDEAYSFLNYAQRPIYQGLADYSSTNNHLLNTLSTHVVYELFGSEEWSLRLAVFGAGLALTASVYWFGRSVFGPDTGLISAVFVAVSDVLVQYSVNARGYTWVAWMAVLLLHAFWRMREPDRDIEVGHSYQRPLVADWCAAWFAAAVGMFAIPTMLFPLLGAVLFAGWGLTRVGLDRRRHARDDSARTRLIFALATWLCFVAMAVFWLYSPALVFRGLEALRHPFVQPHAWGEWLARTPTTWLLALKSSTDGGLPWILVVGFGVIGLARAWSVERRGFWLLASVPVATLMMTAVQRAAPPPRVMSFLAPLFAVAAGFGVVTFVRFLAERAPSELAARQVSRATAWVVLAACAWGIIDSRRNPLPGGARPTHLIEHIPRITALEELPHLEAPTDQYWRLAVKSAVAMINHESQPGDRVLVALPADLPFHFYAWRSQCTISVGGEALRGERLFLVTRRDAEPQHSLRLNPSLKEQPDWVANLHWQPLAIGDLTVWRALPEAPASTD